MWSRMRGIFSFATQYCHRICGSILTWRRMRPSVRRTCPTSQMIWLSSRHCILSQLFLRRCLVRVPTLGNSTAMSVLHMRSHVILLHNSLYSSAHLQVSCLKVSVHHRISNRIAPPHRIIASILLQEHHVV